MSGTQERHDSWTPERVQLRQWLEDTAPALAAVYSSAVDLLFDETSPGRFYLIAHAVREIGNRLPDCFASTPGHVDYTNEVDRLSAEWHRVTRAPGSPDSQYSGRDPKPSDANVEVPRSLHESVRRLVEQHDLARLRPDEKATIIFDALAPGTRELREALLPAVREWVDLLRWFMRHTHVPATVASDERVEATDFIEKFERFETALGAIVRGFFGNVREIDQIVESERPSKKTLKRLAVYLRFAGQARHFFEKIDREWLTPLDEMGYFRHPPAPQPGEEPQSIIHVSWPAARYLTRMAGRAEAQEKVVEILLSVPRTENLLVHRDFVDAALQLPPELAARLAPNAVQWLQTSSPSILLPTRIAELMARLARANERTAALRLLGGFLELVRQPADENSLSGRRSLVRSAHLQHLFDEHLDTLSEHLGLDLLRALTAAAARAIALDRSSDEPDGWEDQSDVWRPAIEQSGWDHDVRHVLLGAMCRVVEKLSAGDGDLRAVVAEFESHRWWAFRRLELYVLSRAPQAAPELVEARLFDRPLFDDFGREFRMLLRAAFPTLSSARKDQVLEWIDRGPDSLAIRKSLEFWNGQPPTDGEVDREVRRWRWSRLGTLDGVLPPGWTESLSVLAAEFGPPRAADYFRPRSSFSVGWRSSIGREELRAKPAGEVAEVLRGWTPAPDAHPLETVDGLADVFGDIVEEDPQRFADEARLFAGVPAIHVTALLGALESSVRKGRVFAWQPVLDLCRAVLEAVPEVPTATPAREARLDDWTRPAVARLLATGFMQNPGALGPESRDIVWQLLDKLTSQGLRSHASDTVEAIIWYAFWVRDGVPASASSPRGFDIAPEAGRALETWLCASGEVSQDVHEACGRRLPWLLSFDEAWVLAHLDALFPATPAEEGSWSAMWSSYLRSGKLVSDRGYRVLRDVYGRAVRELAPWPKDPLPGVRTESRALAEQLVEHLVYLYGRGTFERDGNTDLLNTFLSQADPELRAYAIGFVGRSLRDEDRSPVDPPEPDLPPGVLLRFTALWDRRVMLAKTDPLMAEELPGFGWWLVSGRFDDEWALGQLESVLELSRGIQAEHLVVGRLAALAARFPDQVARCFRKLVTGIRTPEMPYGWLDEAREILGTLLRVGDVETRTEATTALNRLGALGFRPHELLPLSTDLDDPAAIPYFTWDAPMTVAHLRQRLQEASTPERHRLLAQILREAKPEDVWKFTSPQEVVSSWEEVQKHLGRRREFWEFLLKQWKEQGLIAAR